MRKNHLLFLASIFSSIIIFSSCGSKGGGGGPTNPCSGVNISVTGTVTHTSGPGQTNGSIAASATGSTGFTFSINGGAFQSSGNFSGLSAGTYSITAKNGSGCSGSASFTVNNNDPCAGQTFTVGGNPSSATPCLPTPNGSITVTTSGGGSGFTYSLNSGAFQASPTFTNLAPNTYTVNAKEAGGCIKQASVAVSPTTPGTLFAAVKVIINANCATSGCHSGAIPTGGIDFTQDCQIVANAARIKVRAVDNFNTVNQMPPPPAAGLSINDRNAITNWVNAGGLYSN
jgi:SprB repeat